jgi:arylsulfatase A-like enzyme
MTNLGRRARRRVKRVVSRWRRERSHPAPPAAPAAKPLDHRRPAGQGPGRPSMVLVVVVDGLRPDSINPADTPNLDRLRREGVDFIASHAVFPTGTRVNAAAIATGTYPATNGFVGNSLYVPALDPTQPVQGDKHERLLAVAEASGGRLLLTESLADLLAARGLRFAAVGSASPGSTLLLNSGAPRSAGLLVNGGFEPGVRVAYPDDTNREILARFGHAPARGGRHGRRDTLVGWTERVLSEYVLPELQPDVVVNWITEPDHTQHAYGVGSPEALDALRDVDRSLGATLGALERLGLAETTDLFVVSDHGVTRYASAVSVDRSLIDARLKAGPRSDDIVVVGNGPCALLYVKDREPARVRALVEFLQVQEWAGVLFTAAREPAGGEVVARPQSPQDRRACDPDGWVPGTFSLGLIHEDNPERHPDVLLTFPWSSTKNEFGVPGTDLTTIKGAAADARQGRRGSGHGSMSPWAIRNTLLAWGPDFKQGIVDRVPAGDVDVVPTILHLLRLGDVPARDGRVLTEALRNGPDEEQMPVQTRTFTTASPAGTHRAAIQVSEVGHQRYVDKSWRVREAAGTRPASA